MTEATLSEILFAIRPTNIEICPGQKANSFAPTATPRSPKRGSAGRSTIPRYSKLALDLQKLLAGNVSALWTKDGSKAYVEIAKNGGDIEAYLYEFNENIVTPMVAGSAPSGAFRSTLPLLMMAMHPSNKKFEYTRVASQQMVDSMDAAAKTVSPTDLGFLCDCFYYDCTDMIAAHGSSLMVDDFSTTKLNMLQQCVKTNSVEVIDSPFTKFLSNSFSCITYAPSEKSSASNSASSQASVIQDAKDGKYLLAYEWSEEQKSKIRPISSLDDYIPNNSYRKMVRAAYTKMNRVIDRLNSGLTGLDAIKGDYINIILGGRPGTGKTTTADALSATLGLPIYTAKVTRNTEEDSFEGMTKVDGDGKFTVHDTAFLKAFENGGIVVVEEFNLADPGVLQGAIGQAIEYPFILNKDGWMEIRRHPLCIIIATMNTGTQGAREPNQALTSRFPITLTMDDPSETEFLAILEKHGHKKMLCKKVYKAYSSILNYLKNTANDEEMMLCVTMRHCLAALDLVDDGIVENVREAIFDTMIGSIGLRDANLAENVFAQAIKPMGGLD